MTLATESPSQHRDLLEFVVLAGCVSVLAYGVADLLLGLYTAAVIEFSFLIASGAAYVWVHRVGRHLKAVEILLSVGVMTVVTAITLVMGGIIPSGAFVLWLYLVPMAGMVFMSGLQRLALTILPVLLLLVLASLGSFHSVDSLPHYLWPWALLMNILCAGGVLLGTYNYFLSRQKQYQDALRDSEQRYRATIEHSNAAISLKDESGRYLLVNQRFEDLFGIGSTQVVGRTDREIFPSELCDRLEPLEAKVKDSGIPQEAEEQVQIKGLQRTLFSTRFPLSHVVGGKRITCWIALDMTVRTRLQDELRKAQKLENLGTLAGGIAHDFNNLLMACLGHLALASTRPLDEQTATHLGQAERALERATNLTQQLLSFSKGGTPVRAPASIEETIRESASFTLHGSKVKAEFAIAADLPPVEADLGQISQLLQNLTLNAIQAMPEGGLITIAADPWLETGENPGLEPGRTYVRIAVSDTGVGIHEVQLARIFEPFFTTRPGGHGLGLATCLAIARNHDGSIRVKSAVGKGTTFSVFIPATDKPVSAEPHAEVPIEPASLPRRRILVMDDAPEVREVLSSLLRNLGQEVCSVPDERGALAEYARAHQDGHPFELVILDLTIAGGPGGYDTFQRLKAINPKVRAIATSGYADNTVLSNHASLGFFAALRKPFRPGELEKVIRSIPG